MNRNRKYNNKFLLQVMLHNIQLSGSPHISFTADAIGYCTSHLKNLSCINLDEWEWHKEVKEGEEFYVITDFKRLPG